MTFTERLALLVSADTKGAASEVKGLGGAAQTAEKEGNAALGSGGMFQGALNALGLKGGTTGELISTGVKAGAIAGALGIAKLAEDGISKFESLGSEVLKFERTAGTNAEQGSALVFQMQRLGVDPDTAASSIGRMEAKLGSGKLNLQDYNVELAHTHDGHIDMVGTLENVADRFSKIEDPTKRAAMGMAIFGKGWQTLLPYLSHGKEELAQIAELAKKQGLILNQGDVDNAHKLELALSGVKTAFEGFEIQAAKGLAPVVTEFANVASSGLETVNKLTAPLGGLGGAIKFGFDVSPVHNATEAMATFSSIADGDVGGAAEHLVKSLPVVGNVVSGLSDIFGGGGDQAATFKDKQDGLNTSIQKVADLATQGKTHTQEYRDALKQAHGALSDVNKTQQDLNESMLTGAQRLQQSTQLELGKWSADLQARQATDNVKQAQDAFNQALKDHGFWSAEAKAAEEQYEGAIMQAAVAAGNTAVAALGAKASATAKAKAQTDGEIASLQYLAATTTGPVHDAIMRHLEDLHAIPPAVHTTFFSHIDDAVAKIGIIKDQVRGLDGKVITVHVDAQTTAAAKNAFNFLGGRF